MTEIAPWDTPNASELAKLDFDAHVRMALFAVGPYLDTFGDGYGEPYRPNRRAGGTLKDGRVVWAWVRGEKVKK